jgi:hypothetical protein
VVEQVELGIRVELGRCGGRVLVDVRGGHDGRCLSGQPVRAGVKYAASVCRYRRAAAFRL